MQSDNEYKYNTNEEDKLEEEEDMAALAAAAAAITAPFAVLNYSNTYYNKPLITILHCLVQHGSASSSQAILSVFAQSLESTSMFSKISSPH